MPELPEVETVRRGLQPSLEGATVTSVELRRPDLRFPLPKGMAATLAGLTVNEVGRRAKYLLIHFGGGSTGPAPVLICHLGMSGSFRVERNGAADTPGDFHYERSKDAAHDHVVLHVTKNGQTARIVYNDPRRFGFMLMSDEAGWREHPMIAELGIEPTGNTLDGQLMATLFRDKAAPLKSALLDQKLIAGLGNIYVCEALWRAGLSPKKPAGSIAARGAVAAAKAEKLATAVREVIAEAIVAGGSSLRDHIQADGSLGYFQHSFSVYDREGERCPRPECNGVVLRFVQAGRSTFHCPACQR